MSEAGTKPFTGYHMAAILIGFFGIVIAVNIYMAKVAVGTFGGTVVDNSYVASQNYNQWLAEADREARLGWAIAASRRADGKVGLQLTDNGAAGIGFAATAKAEHPLGRAPEQQLRFVSLGDGSYVSDKALPRGRWLLRIEVTRAADRYRTMADIQ
ncbi:FixH family protein [Sphingorhabdus sp.]|jgi:nitrogen fixation protein FixH|uniref:FixH family protein n=1 Tax=Sphingorhabdus sp. TaxID=1902408 RepID=UPI0035B02FA9|nr:FixH family protein [Sphingomonadaceae bacterium]